MNPRLQRLTDQVTAARDRLAKAVKEVQARCAHVEVVQRPWAGDYPRRICVDCGLEEVGSWWSGSSGIWSRADFTPPALADKRGRSVRDDSGNDFYGCRIHGSEVVGKPK